MMLLTDVTSEWLPSGVMINGGEVYSRIGEHGTQYAIESDGEYLRGMTEDEKTRYIEQVDGMCTINCHVCGTRLICVGIAFRIVLCDVCRPKFHS